MIVYIVGRLTDIRRDGDKTFSYVYSDNPEPTLYRIKGEVKGEIGKDVSVLCRANVFKDRIYLTVEGTKK